MKIDDEDDDIVCLSGGERGESHPTLCPLFTESRGESNNSHLEGKEEDKIAQISAQLNQQLIKAEGIRMNKNKASSHSNMYAFYILRALCFAK